MIKISVRSLALLFVLLGAVLYAYAQERKEPAEPEMSEEEFEKVIRKAEKERDRLLSRPQVLYYSPVVDPSGKSIAYVKRTLDYRLKGGGFIPFLSPPPTVTIRSDKVELCRREIGSRREVVLERWVMPKPDATEELVYIAVDLEWAGGQIYYDIHFSGYRSIVIEGGRPCRGGGFCITNKSKGRVSEGQTSGGGVHVSLDNDPERLRFPTSNKIILNCERNRKPCF